MTPNDESVIELDRRKIMLGIAGTIVFVVIGVWLVMLDDTRVATESGFRLLMNNPLLAHGLGVASILLFGTLGVFWIKKLVDKKPGLIFNAEGIVDNAGGAEAGLIPWNEIEGYQIFEISGTKMLMVMVSDPQKYVARGNTLKRKLNAANLNMAGSPISITSKTLATSFDDLVSLFESYHIKYARPADSRVEAEAEAIVKRRSL